MGSFGPLLTCISTNGCLIVHFSAYFSDVGSIQYIYWSVGWSAFGIFHKHLWELLEIDKIFLHLFAFQCLPIVNGKHIAVLAFGIYLTCL